MDGWTAPAPAGTPAPEVPCVPTSRSRRRSAAHRLAGPRRCHGWRRWRRRDDGDHGRRLVRHPDGELDVRRHRGAGRRRTSRRKAPTSPRDESTEGTGRADRRGHRRGRPTSHGRVDRRVDDEARPTEATEAAEEPAMRRRWTRQACAAAGNHGAYVSWIAHLTKGDPSHGVLVSDAAHSDCGKAAAEETTEPTDEATDGDRVGRVRRRRQGQEAARRTRRTRRRTRPRRTSRPRATARARAGADLR